MADRITNSDDGQEELPNDLAFAIARARHRTASSSMVASVTSRVLDATSSSAFVATTSIDPARSKARVSGVWVVAATIGLVFALYFWWPVAKESESVTRKYEWTQPNYTSVKTSRLSHVSYRQIEADLDRAGTTVDEVSEGLLLTAVRFEIQATLDQFYDWSE